MSSNGNNFRVTALLCGEFTGHRLIPRTKASDAELWCFLWSAPEQQLSKNGDVGDLRRHRAHYDIIVMATNVRHLKSCCIMIMAQKLGNVFQGIVSSWWRHDMETLPALLAIYEGNRPVTGSSHEWSVMMSFDVSFVLRLSNLLNKQLSCAMTLTHIPSFYVRYIRVFPNAKLLIHAYSVLIIQHDKSDDKTLKISFFGIT